MILLVEKEVASLEKYHQELLDEIDTLTEEQLIFKPDANSWSIIEVLEHMYLTEKGTFLYIKKQTKRADELKKAGLKSKFNSFVLNRALASTHKYKVPVKQALPTAELNLEELKEKWDSLRELGKKALDMIDVNLANKLIFKHPVAGMLNIIQTLRFLEAHFNHHLKQIARIKKHPDFPQ